MNTHAASLFGIDPTSRSAVIHKLFIGNQMSTCENNPQQPFTPVGEVFVKTNTVVMVCYSSTRF